MIFYERCDKYKGNGGGWLLLSGNFFTKAIRNNVLRYKSFIFGSWSDITEDVSGIAPNQ